MRVAILGHTGMLGSMVAAVFKDLAPQYELRLVSRADGFRRIDAMYSTERSISDTLEGCDWAINCMGVIKPYIVDDAYLSVKEAIEVNALFPHKLATAARESGMRVIQIATDCVWSGTRLNYTETDAHDALDAYGKTKSLGEVHSYNMHHLRCSIVGPEIYHKASLFEWFRAAEKTVNGYTSHMWNGITTLQFAKICHAIIHNDIELGHLQHIVPADTVSKYKLLTIFKNATGKDIEIQEHATPQRVLRTLGTNDFQANSRLWRAAGYSKIPTIEEMVQEMVDTMGRYGYENTNTVRY